MSQAARYEIDRARIIFERFEDETVLVNIENGYYYSASDAGTEVLDLLARGLTSEELTGLLTAGAGDPATAGKQIQDFVGQLLTEGIIVARNGDHTNGAPRELPPRMGSVSAPPVLTRFADMREILLMDPIHQVDPQFGWPSK